MSTKHSATTAINILGRIFGKAKAIPPAPFVEMPAQPALQTEAKPTKAVKAKKDKKAGPEAKRAIKAVAAEGVAHRMREIVVSHPDIDFAAATQALGMTDAKVGGHAWNVYSEAKRVMEIVQARAGRT